MRGNVSATNVVALASALLRLASMSSFLRESDRAKE
jgi:hypothetical protein